MKKLMTMLAAVATAFGLYAADSGFISGAAFDSFDADATAPANITWTDPSGLKAAYWGADIGDKAVLNTDSEKQCKIAEASRPARFLRADEPSREKDGFLEINSGTALIAQKIKTAGTQTIDADKGLYFDGLVQFSAFDETPAIDDEDAKIAVFPMLNDPDDDTAGVSLWVKAFGGTNLWKTAALENPNDWHRVTIKMINNILADGSQAGFVVYVDGTAVSCTDAKAAFDPDDLTPEAKSFYNKAQLFGSLVANTAEITDVAFGGKGAIDEIAFTETAPNFAESPSFCKVTGDTGIASFEADGQKWEGGAAIDAKIENGKVVVTAIKADEGYFIDDDEQELPATKGETVTVTGAKQLGATVVINDVPMYFETAAAALAELNDAEKYADPTTAALTLNADSGALSLDNANITLTLDLAGKKITQPKFGELEEPVAAITLSAASLKIIDTAGNGEVNGNGVENQNNAIDAWDGTLEIAGGTFNGVVGAGDDVLTISSETPKFAYAANKDEDGKCTISYTMSTALTGKQLVVDNEAAPTYWIVGTPKVYVAQIGDDKYETLTEAFNNVKDGEKITLVDSFEYTDNPVCTNAVTLDLNGQTASFNSGDGYALKVDGEAASLTVTDEAGNGVWQRCSKTTFCKILGGGTLTLQSGTIKGTNVNTGCVINIEAGEFTMDGGSVVGEAIAVDDNKREVVRVKSGCTFTMNGGSIIADPEGSYAVNIASGATAVAIKGGSVDGKIVNASELTGIIPSDSTATFDRDQTAFCAEGYGTKEKTTGVWSVEELYTITFTVGDVVETNKIFKGDAVTHEAPTAPTGYSFTGWQPTIVTPAAADADYVAQFTAVEYTITYTTGNGAVVTNGVTKYTIETETFALPVAADIDMSKVEGVTFDGWTNATSEAVVTQVQKGTTGNLQFFAKWAAVAPAEKDPTEDDPQQIPDTEKASDRYGEKVPTTLANVSAKSIATWAQNNGKLVKGAEILENAFLLNCENTEAAINAAKENFKATSITVDSDGKVTVGTPDGALYNGTIKTLGKAALSDAEWSEDLAGKSFFELKLVPTNLE